LANPSSPELAAPSVKKGVVKKGVVEEVGLETGSTQEALGKDVLLLNKNNVLSPDNSVVFSDNKNKVLVLNKNNALFLDDTKDEKDNGGDKD